MSEITNTITFKDLENIPTNLYKELNLPKHSKREFLILNILNSNKGSSDINFIMIKIFKETNEVITRTNMWRILGKMREKGLIESCIKKGFYKVKK